MIIAIDGPAASGKGTLGRRLAARYGLHHLDTGLLYRGVAAALVEAGRPVEDEAAAVRAAFSLSMDDLRPEVLSGAVLAEAASRVAVLPGVRAALLDRQRIFAARKPGAVLDGRDIGTVVCPAADVKIFLIASPEARARRRALQLGLGETDFAAMLAEIRRRDERDTNRSVAPLRPAADAHLLDTTALDIEAALRAAIDIVDRALRERT